MELPDAFEKLSEPINKLLVPLASSVGSTMQDTWELVFGGFGVYVEKKRTVRLKALKEFKASLEQNIAAIPEERLCEPPLSTVGPALEASKYYFEEPEIREMFAKLIAASMDSRTTSNAHPSFTEIIKQMSPLDAQNLKYFAIDTLPVVEYRLTDPENAGRYKPLLRNVFLANPNECNIIRQAQSISSLERLGLIVTSYDNHLTNEAVYDAFDKTEYYMAYAHADERPQITIRRGIALPTPLGKQFILICLGLSEAQDA